ncbi:chromatin structure-remodeling complex subunit RSC7 [Saxophila tyrrhenica]|uniref:Chromatin structure-remodeling complex subunit RSC7 n=1 Tax=Saxophila tyrrhenica TaxID=1690608 RepID=A0AAV9P9D1_9PEZI|nr:chromatin structure-remodeling complex subunit RSC7 [Saxophila tyrrhenica]
MPFQKGHRGARRSSRKSDFASESSTATPQKRCRLNRNDAEAPTPEAPEDASDQDMVDADGDAEDSQNIGTPQPDGNEQDEEEDAGTPAQDDDDAESSPAITTIPRRTRGRGGRRGRSRPDISTPEPGEDGSESGTPFRRRRGRPPGPNSGRGRGGTRGRRGKAGPPEQPRVMDKDGNTLEVKDDEAQVDDDPEGNEKVDALGNLQGGRDYRVRTFTIVGRGERLYMLSTEPARCCGFRDSYLFFTKHPKLFKVLVNEEQKKDLIERDILPSSYKGRNIGVVTARSVFREFGAKIIVGGRRVIDDYKVAEAKANGEVEGELADPDDRLPDNKDDYNRNRYVAWFGASEVYRNAGQGGGAVHPGKPGPVGKRRNNLTVTNWQVMHAREANRFNSHLAAFRHGNLDGVYDTHTNMMFYPKIMQPTHARWEQIPPPSTPAQAEQNLLTNGHTNDTTPNGTHNDSMDLDHAPPQDTTSSTLFHPVPAVITRNFTVIDTTYTAPPLSHTGYPGPDGHTADPASGSNGLSNIPGELVDELPEDCRRAFEEARRTEVQWKRGWGTEGESGLRGGLRVGLSGYPV